METAGLKEEDLKLKARSELRWFLSLQNLVTDLLTQQVGDEGKEPSVMAMNVGGTECVAGKDRRMRWVRKRVAGKWCAAD